MSTILDIMRTQAITIPALATLGLGVATFVSTKCQIANSHQIPLAFSEIGDIEKMAAKEGKQVGKLQTLLAYTNDIPMKIFEASNFSYEDAKLSLHSRAHYFAYELNLKMDPAMDDPDRIKHACDLSCELEKYKPLAEDVMKLLNGQKIVSGRLSTINSQLDQAWSYTTDDHYRTEVYWDTETDYDSDGNSHTHMVMKTRQVYENTTHYFEYSAGAGNASAKNGMKLLKDVPTLELKEQILIAKNINQPNMDAILKSRNIKPEKIPPREVLMNYVNNWYYGSVFKHHMPLIVENYQKFQQALNSWNSHKNGSHSTSYITDSQSDAGPREYQLAENALAYGIETQKYIDEFVGKGGMEGSLQYAKDNMPKVERLVKELIDIEMGGKPGDGDKKAKELMKLTKNIYSETFKYGFETDKANWWLIPLWALGMGAAGALAGWGLSAATQTYAGRRKEEY
jgi:hypothetical protein